MPPTIKTLLAVVVWAGGVVTESGAGEPDRKPEVTSLLGRTLASPPPGADIAELEADLAKARAASKADPDNPDKLIWVGRRLGYLWRFHEAVAVYTKGIERFPDHAALYRHRGHRYISLRQFDKAVADLEKAAALMKGKTDVVEQDGQPNRLNVPLTTLKYNIYYHLGLARYLSGDYTNAIVAFRAGKPHVRVFDDNRIALTYWIHNALLRLGRHANAESELIDFGSGMNVIENHAYHALLMFHKGHVEREKLVPDDASAVDKATLGYGLGVWLLAQGKGAEAQAEFKKVVQGPAWAAFGYIAAEVHLARDK